MNSDPLFYYTQSPSQQLFATATMADVVLLGGALCLTVSMTPKISQQHQIQQQTTTDVEPSAVRRVSPLSISLGLSFCLFALSVLEATPSSWLIVLDNRIIESTDDGTSRDDNGYLTVTYLYFLLLSAFPVYVLVVCPCFVGVLVMEGCLKSLGRSAFCCCTSWEKPWWLKTIAGLTTALCKALIFLFTVVFVVLQKFWRLFFRNRGVGLTKRESNTGSSLPIVKSDTNGEPINGNINSHTNSPDPRVSVACLASRLKELLLVKGGTFLFGSLFGVAFCLGTLHWIAPFIIQPKSQVGPAKVSR